MDELDQLVKAADYRSPANDLVYEGDPGCKETIVVHDEELPIGSLYKAGEVSIRILRLSSEKEFRERCPQVPLEDAVGYFFYGGELEQEIN